MRARGGWAALVGGLSLLVATGAACRRTDPEEARRRARAVVLVRQIEGLKRLVALAEQGRVVRDTHIVLGFDEKLVHSMLAATLPFEAVVGERFRVRLESAEVRFRDTQGVVILKGRVGLAGGADTFADVLLAGGLEEVDIDAGGFLHGRIALYHFEIERLQSGGIAQDMVRNVVEAFGQQSLEALSEALPALRVPVRLDPEVRIKAITKGPIRVEGGRLPLTLAVAHVIALNGRLWVLLDAGAEPWERVVGGEEDPEPPEGVEVEEAPSPEPRRSGGKGKEAA